MFVCSMIIDCIVISIMIIVSIIYDCAPPPASPLRARRWRRRRLHCA